MLQDHGPGRRRCSIPGSGQDCALAVQQPASPGTTPLQGNSCFKHFIEMNFKEVCLICYTEAYTGQKNSLVCAAGQEGFWGLSLVIFSVYK